MSSSLLRFGISSVLLTATALLTPAPSADAAFVGHVYMNDNYRGPTTMGGEFRAEHVDFPFDPQATGTMFKFGLDATAGHWESFCMEKHEQLQYHLELRADLETTTRAGDPAYGGGAFGGAVDPLDARTAYLYHHFINRSLITPYDYLVEANRHLDADELQKAMWFIEEEDTTPLTGKALAFYTEANAAVLSGQWVGLGDVLVMQLYTLENGVRTDYQDQLVIIPAPATTVLSLLGLAIAVRRRR